MSHPTPIPPPNADTTPVDTTHRAPYAAAIEAWERGRRAAELELGSMLTPEQEMRADALAAAARLFPPAGTNAFFWAAVAHFERYIRDGSRPGSTMVCLCTEQQRTEQRWRSDCPAHGARTEAS